MNIIQDKSIGGKTMAGGISDDQIIAIARRQAQSISKQSFSREQIMTVFNQFVIVLRFWASANAGKDFKAAEVHEAILDLILALEISYSNYQKENKTFWNTIFGFKSLNLTLNFPYLR